MSKKTNAMDKAEHRRRKVIALFADPTAKPTVQDVAKVLGVSEKTVTRDLKTVRPDMKEAQGRLEAYQTQLQKHLPIEKRAELVANIAKRTDSPFAQLKAIERADELDGIVTDVERMKARRNDQPSEPAPMFVLNRAVNFNMFGPTSVRTDDNSPAMRNITPGAPEPGTPPQE
jgi:hypothetical protein